MPCPKFRVYTDVAPQCERQIPGELISRQLRAGVRWPGARNRGGSGLHAPAGGGGDRGTGWRGHAETTTYLALALIHGLLLGLSGCAAYDPPVHGDHTSERYKADLEKCSTVSAETVRRKNAATPGTWIMSAITGPPEVRAAIRTCMESKGYALDKVD
jgi:hypothetical protein